MGTDATSTQTGVKGFIAMFGPSDLVGLFGAIVGAIGTVCSTVKNPVIQVICITISQVLLLFAWVLLLSQRYRNRLALLNKDREIYSLNNEVDNKKSEYEKQRKELDALRERMIKQLFSISNCVKSNNIHNNDMLVRIPLEADEQYALLERLETALTDESGSKQIKDLQKEAIESAQKYATQLFDLFNRYCRSSTDEAVKLQNAYLTLKGIPLKVSITVKLMDKPYHPEQDRSEDIKVYTAFRDNEAFCAHEREIGEHLYSIGGNTDFTACLRKDYFIINRADKQGDSYSNEHRGYDKFYNSAIVVPIRIKRNGGEYKFFGYLCCDCLNQNQAIDAFDKSSAQYLFAFAQNMGTFLETLDANWIDRYKVWENVSDNILEMLYKKIYKPR